MRLLIELRFDESPLTFVEDRMRVLATRVFESLTSRGIGPTTLRTGHSTRRLVLEVDGIPDREPDREEWLLGPSVEDAVDAEGGPGEPWVSFAAEHDVEPERLEVRHTLGGDRVGLLRRTEGRPVGESLPAILQRVLDQLDPESEAVWGGDLRGWIRPLRGFLALAEEDVVSLRVGPLEAGRTTVAHPVLAPEPLEVPSVVDYFELLRARGVEPLTRPRRKVLSDLIEAAAQDAGGTVRWERRHLDRITARCEVPGVLLGRLPSGTERIPEELLVHSLLERLGALIVHRPEGQRPESFVWAMDRSGDESGRTRVLVEWAAEAVVADVRFFFEADRKVTLAERARLLGDHLWEEVGGTWAEKQLRVERLAVILAERAELAEDSREMIRQAAGLLKVDRTTELVAHLPELRGVVGGYYAKAEGYAEPVWTAVREQYLPLAASGRLPSTPEGRVLALADRLDTLVGMLGMEQESVAGSERRRDLRRLGRGIVRLLVESGLHVDLDLLLARAVLQWQERLGDSIAPEELVEGCRTFLGDRLRQHLGESGLPNDVVEAVLAVDSRDPLDVVERASAVVAVRGEAGFGALVVAAKRVFGLVSDSDAGAVDPDLVSQPAERELFAALEEIAEALEGAARERRFEDLLRKLLHLVAPLERFLQEVHVMDEDPRIRSNRVALLQAVRRRFWRVARLKELSESP